jgi:hypothetical protein
LRIATREIDNSPESLEFLLAPRVLICMAAKSQKIQYKRLRAQFLIQRHCRSIRESFLEEYRK